MVVDYRIFCDGGARGNPGPAAAGCLIEMRRDNEWRTTHEFGQYLGQRTNNQAEYAGLIMALEWVSNQQAKTNPRPPDSLPAKIEVIMDSELVVKQARGEYRVKNDGLKPLHARVSQLVVKLGGNVVFRQIGREGNKRADQLVNQTLDQITNPKS